MASGIFIVNLVHLLCLFVAWGVTIWIFIIGIIMFGVLPRHMLGNLRSKIFPKYFSIMVTCNSGLLATASFWWSDSSVSKHSSKCEFGYLLAAFLLNWTSLLLFAPLMVQVVKQRHKIERKLLIGKQIGWSESRRPSKPNSDLAAVNRKFHAIHTISALSFTVSLGCLAIYAGYLAPKINL